jgi:hypothetical protein
MVGKCSHYSVIGAAGGFGSRSTLSMFLAMAEVSGNFPPFQL